MPVVNRTGKREASNPSEQKEKEALAVERLP